MNALIDENQGPLLISNRLEQPEHRTSFRYGAVAEPAA
jgi:hypothetical protein